MRTLPSALCAMALGIGANQNDTSPRRTAVIASGTPLVGKCTSFRSAACRNVSPARNVVLATPAEVKLCLPGSFFARSMNSCSDLTGRVGGTITMNGTSTRREMPTKSATGSNWTFLLIVLAMTCPFDVTIRV